MLSAARKFMFGFAAVAAVLLLSAAAPPAAGAQNTARLSREQTAALDAAGSNALAHYSAPGFAFAVERDGVTLYARGFGLRDIARGKPVDARTVFALGPITKQFTAAAIELLVLSHEVSLDAKVAAYLPNAPHASEIRVSDLLHETSGLPDYLAPDTLRAITTSTSLSPQAILETVAGKPLDFSPGSRCEHSGTNYVALGAIIEAVSGKPYGGFVHDAIAVPLGLRSLTFGPPPVDSEAAADVTNGYDLVEYGRRVEPWSAQATSAAGGLYASVSDIAKWDAAFYGGKLLPADAVAELTTPAALADGTASSCAAGAVVDAVDGTRDVSQRGGIPGTSVLNSWSAATNTATIVLGNSIAFDPGELQHAAAVALLPPILDTAREAAAETAKARAEYRAWEYGTVDPARYGDGMQKLIASPAALDISATLKAAGDPAAFTFEGTERIGSSTLHRYRAETAHGTFEMNVVYAHDGTIVKVAFARTN